MSRISSLIVATTMAILPISAFAQQTVGPVNPTAPTGITTQVPATTAPASGKTAVATPAAKIPSQNTKTEVHGMNNVSGHHAKVNVPAKTTEPVKS